MDIWVYGYTDIGIWIYIYISTCNELHFQAGDFGRDLPLVLRACGFTQLVPWKNDGCHARPTLRLQGEPLGYDQPKWDNHWDTESDNDDNDE